MASSPTIISSSYSGLYTWTSGDLTVGSTGSVTDASGTGIEASSSVTGNLTNAGQINGAGWGAVSVDGAITTLTNTGTITGNAWGIAVQFDGSIGTLNNSGVVIGGGIEALSNNGKIAQLINSGTLSGGIFENGGTNSTIGTIVNTGTITADIGGQAIDLSNNLSASVILSNSGTITGNILFSPNADILTITGGSISGNILASVAGHGTVDIAVGAGNIFRSSYQFGGQTSSQSSIAPLAAVVLDSGSLAISAANINASLIEFSGADTGLALSGISTGLSAAISGFSVGDVIDLTGAAATAATMNASNQLVVTNNGITVAKLQLAQNYAGLTFTVASDGAGGSNITVNGTPSGTVPIYGMSSDSQSSVTEGGTENFTITTKGVAAGTTLFYSLSGVTASQIVGDQLTGTVAVASDGITSLPVSLAGTLGAGLSGTMTATLSTSANGPAVASASVTLVETSPSATIIGTSYSGLYTWASGNLTVASTGSVTDTSGTGIEASSSVTGNLTNAGQINGAGWGAVSVDGAITTLTNTGTITGNAWGIAVQFDGSIGTLNNSGVVIGGGIEALSNNGKIAQLINSGTLSGGIFENGGTNSTIGTIVNTGTITADIGGQAIDLSNNLSASVILSNSGTITGNILFSPNADILTITGGSISGNILASVAGHGTVDIAVGAGNIFRSSYQFGGQTSSQSSIAPLAAVVLDSGSLAISAANINASLIEFSGADTGLALSGISTGLSAAISGFSVGDVIDLTGAAATAATMNASNQLVVTNNGITVAKLQLAQNYAGLTFTVASDGAGGSNITVNGTPSGTVPIYGMSSDSQSSVTEGGTENFTITTKGVAAGTTLFYSLSGVTASQIVGDQLTGTVAVASDGITSLPVSLAGTLGAGLSGTMTATLSTSANGPAVASASVTLVETSPSATIIGTSYSGLYTWASGNLTVASTGSVTDTSGTGIEASSSVTGNLTNAGQINGAGWGAVSVDGAITTLTNTGTITGNAWGIAVQFDGSIGTLNNSGVVIGGGFEALSNNGKIAQLINSGTLSGGIFENGGTNSTIGTIVNTGTITADIGGQAIDLSNNLSASVILSNSGTITGNILFSPNADILTITGGSISGNILASVAGHGTVDIAVGAGNIFRSSYQFGGQTSSQSSIAPLAAVVLDSGSLAISAANINASLIEFSGADTGLALSGISTGLSAAISGFSVGDVIDLTGAAATAATMNASNQLVVTNNGITVAKLQLAQNYAGLTFTVASDGAGGSNITVNGTPSGTVPIYGMSSDSQSSVTEGGTENFTITTKGVAAGTTLFYSLSGVTASQIVGDQLTGTVAVASDGITSLPVSLAGTLGAGLSGTMTATLSTSANGPAVASASVTLVETSPSATIIGTSYSGLYTWASGNLTVASTGSVTDTSGTGIEASSSVTGNLTNAGQINGAGWGAVSVDGAITTLTNTGTITGNAWGIAVQFDGSIGTLNNSGVVIGGGFEALSNNGKIAQLINSGTLSGGIFENGGTNSTIGTIVNTGTITADIGGQAIDLSNNLSASVILSNSGTITGNILFSPNADILTITGGSISGNIVASVAGHGTVDIAVGAGNTYRSSSKFGGQTFFQASPAPLAAVALESGSLAISAANLNTNLIDFSGTDTGLMLSGISAGLSAAISGFSVGDVIDLTGTAATAATMNASNQLVVTNNGTTVATLQMAQDYSGLNFTVASDGAGGSDLTATLRSPTVSIQTPNQTLKPGEDFNLALSPQTFIDPRGQQLTYTASMSGGAALPAWLSFNANTDSFSGIVPAGVETLSLTVTATDTSDLAASDTFKLIMPAWAPVISAQTSNQTWLQGQSVSFTLPAGTFTDLNHQAMTFSAKLSNGSQLPSWLNFNASTETFSGIVPAGMETLAVSVTATNTGHLSTTETFNVIVPASAPKVSQQIPEMSVMVGQKFAIAPLYGAFSDPQNSNLNYSISQANGQALPSWMKFNSSSGLLSGTAPTTEQTVALMVKATDSYGLSVADSFTFDAMAPSIVVHPVPDVSATPGKSFIFSVPLNTFFVAGAAIVQTSAIEVSGPNAAWLHYNNVTHSLSGTVPINESGTITMELTGIDNFGTSAVDIFHINIR